MQLPGVQDAFVGARTVLHLTEGALTRAQVTAAVAPLGVTVESFGRDDEQLWPVRRPLRVAIVLYPGVELLDFAGPAAVFSAVFAEPGCEVFTVAATRDPVPVQRQASPVVPTYAVDACPPPDVLVVPGGATKNLAPLMDWIERTVPATRHTLTVCNAAVELGRVGLLDGLAATTHAGCLDLLRRAAPRTEVREGVRFVDNGRIVTAAGVSAGLDAALHLVARTHGEEAARATARFLEYPWEGRPR